MRGHCVDEGGDALSQVCLDPPFQNESKRKNLRVAQTDHILILVKQIAKEYSHSWDSGQECVDAHYSPQASSKIRFVSHSSLYSFLIVIVPLVQCLCFSVDPKLCEQGLFISCTFGTVGAWHREGSYKHLLKWTVPIPVTGKIWLWGGGQEWSLYVFIYNGS